MDVNIIKVIVLVTLFAVTLVCICLPFKAVTAINRTIDRNQRRKYKQTLSLLNCFGGGVFLGACLLDLFPESRENLDKILKSYKVRSKFPVAEFVMVYGFFVVFVVEQIVLHFREVGVSNERTPLLRNRQSDERDSLIGGISDQPIPVQHPKHDLEESNDDHSLASTLADDNLPHSKLRTFVLLVSLSLHSIFEGMAIGLQRKVDSVVQLFIVVIIHKSVIAFSLGLSVVQSKLTLGLTVVCCSMFCLASPLGLALGIALDDIKDSVAASVSSGVLQGLACGTFLYVTFFEILPHEMNSRHNRMFKILSILVGFATICTVLFFDPVDS